MTASLRIISVVAAAFALLWAGAADAHEVTFEVQTEAGQPVEGSLDWNVFGPTSIMTSQSSGSPHTISLEDGECTVILMRTGAQTAQDFSFTVEGADRIIPVILLPEPDLSPPKEMPKQWVTIRVLDEPASDARVTEYRWSLSHEEDVFFRKAEPAASLDLPLAARPTNVTIMRMPDRETVQFSITPDTSTGQVFEFEWPAVSIGRVQPEDKNKIPEVSVTLAPRVSEGQIIVTLSFEAGVPIEGDTVWLSDGTPGGLAMGFVEPNSSEVMLTLPEGTPTDGLSLIYRRSQTLAPMGEARLP